MITSREYTARLYGRQHECGLMAELVDKVRRGHGAVLVVRGEPGTGKTALLDQAAALAAGLRVLWVAGTESEAELAYAGLCQLCGPMAGLLGKLPDPQRAVLEIAFGLRAGTVADRFLLGLGVHGLLTAAAAGDPLVCVIDDAQWLDRASRQALAFAARRLSADPVLVIFACRQPGADLTGLPGLALGGLPDAEARDLLTAAAPGPLDARVLDQIVAEAHGNPRALAELLRGVPPAQLAGGFGLSETPQCPIPAGVPQQLRELPAPTRSLVLLAAADPTGDPVLMLRAAGKLGIAPEAMYPAAEAGLLTCGARIVFREPAVRMAAYQAARQRDRRAAHDALARATMQPGDEDRRAWHRGKAALGPDEDAAAELERTAVQARARGGLPAFAAFLESAVLLTADTDQRARRALAAAAAMLQAGAPDGAARLLDLAAVETAEDHWQARASLIRARLAFTRNRNGQAPRLLLAAARRLDGSDGSELRGAYLEAFRAVTFAGGLAAPGGTVTDVANAAAEAADAGPPGQVGLLLDGLTAYFTGERPAGAAILRRALSSVRGEMTAAEELRWLPLARAVALYLWDDAAWDSLSGRCATLARDVGALGELPVALDSLACLHLLRGELSTAESLTAQARAVAEATGSRPTVTGALGVAAMRGDRDLALTLIDGAARDAAPRDEGLAVAAARWASAVLHNALGQYPAALAAAGESLRYAGTAPLAGWAAAELVEAAARSGQPELAAEAMRGLSISASAAGTGWALGIRARSLALLSDGTAAEDQYRAAVQYLGRSQARVELARAHLLYGEWLRRKNRRVDAREQLRLAHGALDAIGAAAFAERARRELAATGETVRKRTTASDRDLTAQEMQIAVRARDGQTNTRIGAELFLSPRTVEWHLRKVFAKLGIASRRQLPHALGGAAAVPCGHPL